jgi:hypothetical protein
VSQGACSCLGFTCERRLARPQHDPKRTPLHGSSRGPSRSQLAGGGGKARAQPVTQGKRSLDRARMDSAVVLAREQDLRLAELSREVGSRSVPGVVGDAHRR